MNITHNLDSNTVIRWAIKSIIEAIREGKEVRTDYHSEIEVRHLREAALSQGLNLNIEKKDGYLLVTDKDIQKDKSSSPEPFTTSIGGCARCGKNHSSLLMTKFVGEKVTVGPSYKIVTHFTICPNTRQPILLYINK